MKREKEILKRSAEVQKDIQLALKSNEEARARNRAQMKAEESSDPNFLMNMRQLDKEEVNLFKRRITLRRRALRVSQITVRHRLISELLPALKDVGRAFQDKEPKYLDKSLDA
jgi:hypothetical protein